MKGKLLLAKPNPAVAGEYESRTLKKINCRAIRQLLESMSRERRRIK
jgi:hypothetical protein